MNFKRKNALLWALWLALGSALSEPIPALIDGELAAYTAVDLAVDMATRAGVTFVIAFPLLFAYASWRSWRNR